MATLTDPTLSKAKWQGKDRWLSDGGSRGAGRLVVKIAEAGVTFYYAYYGEEAKRRFLPVGIYGKQAGCMSLIEARSIAGEHSKLYRSGVTNLHDHYRRERDAKRALDDEADEAQRREAQMAKEGSLRRLLECYCEHLERAGKYSQKSVRACIQRNVFDAFPELCEQRASTVTTADLRRVVAELVTAKHGREAAKLRSYLRAAYSLAMKAVGDAAASEDLHSMGIENNPAANLASLSNFNKPGERVLSAPELRHYWRRVQALPESAKRDALVLALLLAGQRPTQLLRVQAADVDLSARLVTLRDPKGRRKQVRLHVIPLTDQTAEIFARLVQASDAEESETAPSLFTSDGVRRTNISTLSHAVSDISGAMLEAKETRAPFQMRDVRRTAETMLAALGVQRDSRAQLLSHGLSGVQHVNYDRHDYQKEKRAALDAWELRLAEIATDQQAPSNVIGMRRDQAA